MAISTRRLAALAVLAASTIALALVGAAPVRADGCDDTWTGADSGNWSDPGNWAGDTVPATGDTLCFPPGAANTGVTHVSPPSFSLPGWGITDDLPNLEIGGLSFSDSTADYDISGTLNLQVGATLNLDGGYATIAGSLALAGGVTIQGSKASGGINLLGSISGPGSITISEVYTEFGNPDNTFTGGVTATGAEIVVNASGSLGTGVLTESDGLLLVVASRLDNDIEINSTGNYSELQCSVTPAVFSGTITMTGPTTVVGSSSSCSLTGPISGPYPLTLEATVSITGTSTYTGGTVLGPSSTMLSIAGSAPLGTGPVNIEQAATLAGTGTIGNLTSAGTLAPGGGAGQAGTLSTGSLTLASGSTFATELDSPSTFDAVIAGGAVDISGANLDATLGTGYQPGPGTSFTIIRNRSGQPVSGTFAGLPEGAEMTVGGTVFHITYQGNGEDDVVISTVQPSTPTPVSIVTPSPSPSPTPTSTPVATPSPQPTPAPVTIRTATPPSSGSPAVVILGVAALILLLVGLGLALEGPIRRRVEAWRHRAG
ncbi:MAG: hypothetical protein ACLQGJ_12855 [Candidatus Dormibacteria bacterium]